jgi:hypothetical protein
MNEASILANPLGLQTGRTLKWRVAQMYNVDALFKVGPQSANRPPIVLHLISVFRLCGGGGVGGGRYILVAVHTGRWLYMRDPLV